MCGNKFLFGYKTVAAANIEVSILRTEGDRAAIVMNPQLFDGQDDFLTIGSALLGSALVVKRLMTVSPFVSE